MSDWPWVVAAYALTWIVLGGYAWRVLRLLHGARQEFESERLRTERSNEEHP